MWHLLLDGVELLVLKDLLSAQWLARLLNVSNLLFNLKDIGLISLA